MPAAPGRSESSEKEKERACRRNRGSEKEETGSKRTDERGRGWSGEGEGSRGKNQRGKGEDPKYSSEPSQPDPRQRTVREGRRRQCRSKKVGRDSKVRLQDSRPHRSRTQTWSHRYRESRPRRRRTVLLLERGSCSVEPCTHPVRTRFCREKRLPALPASILPTPRHHSRGSRAHRL